MKRSFLENLGIEEKDLIDKILDENSSDIGKAKGNLETKETEIKNLKSEIDTLKTQVGDRDKQLETLKNSNDDVTKLKEQIQALIDENKNKDEVHAKELNELKINSIVENAILTAKGKNSKAIKALLDFSNIKLNKDGGVDGLDEQIKNLMKADDSKFLFDEARQTKPNVQGVKPDENSSNQNTGTRNIDISKMSYSEFLKTLENQ